MALILKSRPQKITSWWGKCLPENFKPILVIVLKYCRNIVCITLVDLGNFPFEGHACYMQILRFRCLLESNLEQKYIFWKYMYLVNLINLMVIFRINSVWLVFYRSDWNHKECKNACDSLKVFNEELTIAFDLIFNVMNIVIPQQVILCMYMNMANQSQNTEIFQAMI